MTKRPHLTERTRENLVHAFLLLVEESGMSGVTAKQVAARAGYNRGTFYEYFSSVSDLVSYVEDQCLPTIDELPPPGPPAGGAVAETTGPAPELVEAVVDLFESKADYYRVLLAENGDPSFHLRLQRALTERLASTLVAPAPAGGQEPAVGGVGADGRRAAAGESGEAATEARYLLDFLVSGLIGVMVSWYRRDRRPDAATVVDMMYRFLSTPPAERIRRMLERN